MLLLEVALPWIEVIPLDTICISKDLNTKKQSTNTDLFQRILKATKVFIKLCRGYSRYEIF